jgi:hypothetical protein
MIMMIMIIIIIMIMIIIKIVSDPLGDIIDKEYFTTGKAALEDATPSHGIAMKFHWIGRWDYCCGGGGDTSLPMRLAIRYSVSSSAEKEGAVELGGP